MSETVGHRVRALRKLRGLSQTELAGDDLSGSYVSLIEADRRTPTAEVLQALAERLGVESGELSTGTPPDVLEKITLDARYAAISLLNGEARAAEMIFSRLAGELAGLSPPRQLEREVQWGLGRAQEWLGDLGNASVTLEGLYLRTTQSDAAPSRTDVLIARIRNYRQAGDYSRAIELGEKALEELRGGSWGAPAGPDEISALAALSACYENRGDLLRAHEIVQAALKLSAASSDPTARGRAYWSASTLAMTNGRYDEAIVLADKSIAAFEETDNLRSLGALHINHAYLGLMLPDPDIPALRAELEAARDSLVAVGSAADVGSVTTELARCALLEGDFETARTLAADASANCVGPDRADALLIEARAAMSSGERDIAEAILEATIATLDEVGVLRDAAPKWREVANLARELGLSDLAMSAFESLATCCSVSVPSYAYATERTPQRLRS